MSVASLLKQYLLQNYEMTDRIYMSKKLPETPTPPPKKTPPPQKTPPQPPTPSKEFTLNKKRVEKAIPDSAVERLKNFYATKVFLTTSEEEYLQNSLFFDRLSGAISNKLHRCTLVNLDKEQDLKQLEEAIANGSCVSVVGTKTSLRLYPKLKSQHNKIEGVHHLIHSPLIFIEITDDPEKKKKLWKEIKTYTHR